MNAKREDMQSAEDGEYTHAEISEFWGSREGEGIVLDLGSGPGSWSRFLDSRGYDVVAVDINTDVFLLEDYKGVARLVCDAEYLPFRRNIFGSVFCVELLEHLHKPKKCVKEVSYILRSRGEFMCSTPCLNIPFFRGVIIKLYRGIINIEPKNTYYIHQQVFSDNQLFDMLHPYFKIVKTKYTKQTIILTLLFGIDRSMWDRRLRFLPHFLLRYLAQGIMVLCQKEENEEVE